MPTRPKKGGGANQDTTGDAQRGGQKATYGSTRSPEVADAAADAARAEDATGREQERNQ